ncbi:LacI family DNA-binding transcriptional regulator [Candidatus Dormiibacter inghamiae]|uniref:LacI family DNA-binding transcriptional regulator n=1 Tax=Candidatus Dormiibacter inghamiae TaxID=3127013 RepID=UPI0030C70B4B
MHLNLRSARVVRISDVAHHAGVTAAVVSRVLSGDNGLRIREETRQRVLEAAAALDYTPNRAAQTLRLATSGAIGLIEHDVSNPLHAETVRGAQRSAGAAGYVTLLADAEELAADEAAYKELLASGRIDGVVLHLGGWEADDALRKLAESRLPTVLINSQLRTGAGSVVLQDEQAAEVATCRLLDQGHTRIGFLGGISRSAQSKRRLNGVRRTLQRVGLELPNNWLLEAGFDQQSGRRAMSELLAMRCTPTGLVVANVMAAIGALAAAHDHGVLIPQDLSVIAIHDSWVAEHTCPPLTTVRLPLFHLGEAAVQLLVLLIQGAERKHIVLRDPPPRLIERGSVGPAPALNGGS